MSTLFGIWNTIQYKLFPWLEEELDPLTEKEIILEVSVEKDIIVALMAGEQAVWKGTLKGLKELLGFVKN